MLRELLLYTGNEGNANIFLATPVNGVWNPLQLQAGINTSAAPAAVMFGNGLYMLYKGNGADQNIWIAQPPATGTGEQVLAVDAWVQRPLNQGVTLTNVGPGAEVFEGAMYVFYVDATTSGSRLLVTNSTDGETWSDPAALGSGISTDSAPAPIVFNGVLYVFYKGIGNNAGLFVARSTDGQNWTQTQLSGITTSTGAGVVVLAGILYAFYSGTSGSANIFMTRSSDAATWSAPLTLPGSINTSSAPAAVIMSGAIHVYYKGATTDPNIYSTQSTDRGNTWSNAAALNAGTVASSNAPVAIVVPDQQFQVPGQYFCVEFDETAPGSQVNLGADLGVAIGGSTPFAIKAFIAVDSSAAAGSILAQPGVYDVSIASGRLTVSAPGQSSVSVGPNFIMGPGVHVVAVTFDGSSVTLIVDGLADSPQSFTFPGNNGNDHILGAGFTGRMMELAIFSRPGDIDVVLDDNVPVAQWGATRYFDFSQSPPVDDRNSVTVLGSGVKSALITPALQTNGTGMATSEDPAINPGGPGNDAYTVQAWVKVDQPSPFVDTGTDQENFGQIIFSNTDVGGTSGIMLYLAPAADGGNGYDVVARRGAGKTAVSVRSDTTVPVGQWVNVGMTYDPGLSKLTVFLNGTAVGSGPAAAMQTMNGPNVAVAGAFGDSPPPRFDTFNCFQGYIASVLVFSTALSAQQIATNQTTLPSSDPDLVGSFSFAGTTVNAVTGVPLSLIDTAVLTGSVDPPPPPASVSDRTRDSRAHPRTKMPPASPFRDPGTIAAADLARFRREAEERWRSVDFRAELEKALEKDLPVLRRRSLHAEAFAMHRKRLTDAYEHAIAVAAAVPFAGPGELVLHHALEDDWVLVAHGPRRSVPLMRVARNAATECVLWQIGFVVTVVAGLLAVFCGYGGGGTSAPLRTFVQTQILNGGQGAGTIMATLSLMTVSGVSAAGLFACFFAIFSSVGKAILGIIFSGLGLIWAIAKVLSLLAVQPWGAAVVLAQITLAIAKVVVELANKPHDCQFGEGFLNARGR